MSDITEAEVRAFWRGVCASRANIMAEEEERWRNVSVVPQLPAAFARAVDLFLVGASYLADSVRDEAATLRRWAEEG